MKFNDLEYIRPNAEKAAKTLALLAADVAKAKNDAVVLGAYAKASEIQDDIASAATVASIRHTVDTTDTFYDDENNYFDEVNPLIADKVLSFYRAVLASKHRAVLSREHGEILLQKMEVAVKSSDERLIPLQQRENALETEYEKLYAGAKIPFEGEILTVAQLGPHKQSTRRATRRAAFEAEGGFFDSHREQLDDIYTRMVQNRTEQAALLGYESFTPLGDIRTR